MVTAIPFTQYEYYMVSKLRSGLPEGTGTPFDSNRCSVVRIHCHSLRGLPAAASAVHGAHAGLPPRAPHLPETK